MTTDTLTDRYVAEVVRRIPADQREDVAVELNATIADTVDAHESEDRASAERAVIADLGDPIRLAARYADRPLSLIGPALYPAYIRLLAMILWTVVPIVTAIAVIADVVENDDIGAAIGTGIGALFTVASQIFVWLTLIFAFLDRFRAGDDVDEPWTPDHLPHRRQSDRPSAGASATVVWNIALLALILWQYSAEPYRGDGDTRLAVLDPELWSGWIWPVLAGLAAIAVIEVIRIRRGSWSMPLAAWYAGAEALVSLPLAWLLYEQRLLNPDFVAAIGTDQVAADSWWSAAALVVLGIGIVEVSKRFRDAREGSGTAPLRTE
ncbi:MAG TPA: hypothetical protein VK059_14665 [Nocardioidaceae bacterium]|nr:hypothetical protein [Nocardioidaceae bacterium]